MTAGCSSSGIKTFKFSGAYWEDTPTGDVSRIYEELTYKVFSETFEQAKAFAPSGVQNTDLTYTVDSDNSSYKTVLCSSDDLKEYILTTELTISGTYVSGGKEYYVSGDTVITETHFKSFADGFKPISSKKQAKNTVLASDKIESEADLKKVGYTYEITYGKVAEITLTPDEDEDSQTAFITNQKSAEIKKYDKNAYIDNELIITLFRAFKYGDDATTFSYSFNCIDSIACTLKSLSATAKNYASSQSGVSSHLQLQSDFPCPFYNANNVKREYTAFGVCFQTTGNSAQYFTTAYYATALKGNDGANTKNCPVKIYQNSIYNTGYIVYSLVKAENK